MIEHYAPTPTSTPRGDAALEWYGEDSTGRELHVIVVVVEAGEDPLDPDLAGRARDAHGIAKEDTALRRRS